MSVFLHGLGLQFYRGIGADAQFIGPFKQFNFFIGKNNSGKSIVLDFISNYLPLRNDIFSKLSSNNLTEKHIGAKSGEVQFHIGVPKITQFLYPNNLNYDERQNVVSDQLILLQDKCDYKNLIWLSYENSKNNKLEAKIVNVSSGDNIRQFISSYNWQHIWHAIRPNMSGGDLNSYWFPETMQWLSKQLNNATPETLKIPAFRRIGQKGEELKDASGVGLIDKIAELEKPLHHRQNDKQLFIKINNFLREVIDEPDAVIEIPHDRSYIIVNINGKALPLDSLGTGIHEIVLIAAFCTINQNQIICIEEPEIHLHPILQRKLIEYLKNNTKNQYFIATHSASIIDTPDSAIFHVTNDGNQTTINSVQLDEQKIIVLNELGYKASDLLQSNSIIWVEGPSDRTYINYWLNHKAPELIEKIHYSIMFYGGGLLSHITADWENMANDLIELRKINSNVAVIMDSDRISKNSHINKSKKRIIEELKDSFCWITKGHEIENYLPFQIFQDACKVIHPRIFKPTKSSGDYDDWFGFDNPNKAKIALEVIKSEPDFSRLDLNVRINELIAFIKRANHME